MSKNNPSNRPSPKSSYRFLIEIGLCILFALIFFLYFNPIPKNEEGLKELEEIERELDELSDMQSVLYMPVKVGSTHPKNKWMWSGKYKMIEFHEIWLTGLEKKYKLPKSKLNPIKERINNMKNRELDLMLELEVSSSSESGYVPYVEPDYLDQEEPNALPFNERIETVEEDDFDDFFDEFEDLDFKDLENWDKD